MILVFKRDTATLKYPEYPNLTTGIFFKSERDRIFRTCVDLG